MKAIVLRSYGAPSHLSYEDVAAPAPGLGEVLVRMKATSVNPVDWMLRSGVLKDLYPVEFPYILGLDVAGIVEAIGAAVTGFAIGDRVMGQAFGTYAQLCAAPAEHLVAIPEGLGFTDAAALPLVNLTGHQLALIGAKAAATKTIVITGALGSVGRSAVFAAASCGATVIAGVRAARLEEARHLPGVADAIALDRDEEIRALPLVDGVADAVGGELGVKLLEKVKPGGSFGCFPPSRAVLRDHPHVEINTIIAQHDPQTTRHYAEAVRDGHLIIPISAVVPLAEAPRAHHLAEQGARGKVVLEL